MADGTGSSAGKLIQTPLGDVLSDLVRQFGGDFSGRKLAADSMPGESESTVEHGPHFAIEPGCRTINSQRAVGSVLTDCLGPGVHPNRPT